jgi:hypothetical protein
MLTPRSFHDLDLTSDDVLMTCIRGLVGDKRKRLWAQTRVLDLPATHIDARHPKYIALRPIPGAAVAPPSGDT